MRRRISNGGALQPIRCGPITNQTCTLGDNSNDLLDFQRLMAELFQPASFHSGCGFSSPQYSIASVGTLTCRLNNPLKGSRREQALFDLLIQMTYPPSCRTLPWPRLIYRIPRIFHQSGADHSGQHKNRISDPQKWALQAPVIRRCTDSTLV